MPNVEHQARKGRWVFRAKIQIEGARQVGPWRDSIEEAAQDVGRIKAGPVLAADLPVTIGEAVAARILEARQAGAQPNTLELYRSLGERFAGEVWSKDAPLTEIDAKELVAYVREFRQEIKDDEGRVIRKARTANTIIEKDFVLLASLYKLAGIDPCPVRQAKQILKGELRRTTRSKHFFTPEEVRKLLKRVRFEKLPHDCRGRERHADVLELVAFTGIRQGELARAKPEHFDLDSKSPSLLIPAPKDRSNPRRIPLSGAGLEAAKRLVASALKRGDELLLGPDGRNYAGNILRRWKLRLGEPGLSLRALRHSFITTLLQEGVAPATVMHLAGHRNIATTMRYTHELKNKSNEAVSKLDKLFG